MRGEKLPVDSRLVVVALEESGRCELDEIRVPLVRLGEERQVGIPLRLCPPVVRDVDLAAKNRLDTMLTGLSVQLDCTGKGAMIGERDGGHLELRSTCGKVRNAARAIEDRVLGVDM